MIAPIAVTAGEPAGIGPDLCVQLAQQAAGIPWIAIADPDLLVERAELLGLPLAVHRVDGGAPVAPHAAGSLNVLPVLRSAPTTTGHPDPGNARYVLATLEQAVDGCLDGTFSAMVTGPVHKGVINDAGIPFTGHTEFIAARSGGHPS
jgi:4-hydroxythreonine-4-phosphate dehydrogenase